MLFFPAAIMTHGVMAAVMMGVIYFMYIKTRNTNYQHGHVIRSLGYLVFVVLGLTAIYTQFGPWITLVAIVILAIDVLIKVVDFVGIGSFDLRT